MAERNLNRASKFISLILRHKPEVANITLDKHGWADVKELLIATKLTQDELDEIVSTDNKQRYSYNLGKTKIRANQGHSIDVDLEFKEAMPPCKLYHGTVYKNIESIFNTGLNKQSRQYVHLSSNIETAISVGKRRGNPVVLEINTEDMIKDGYKFYISENKVWLTDNVPAKYIKITYDLKDTGHIEKERNT